MNQHQQPPARSRRDAVETPIRRSLDGSIDMAFYRRRAHCLRSGVAWDIINHMSRMLPFFRSDRRPSHREDGECTML